MRLSDALKLTQSTQGLPMGDTYITIDTTEAEEIEFKDFSGKPVKKWVIKSDGKEYVIPPNLMRDIKTVADKGAKIVRITRTGEKANTRYNVLAQP